MIQPGMMGMGAPEQTPPEPGMPPSDGATSLVFNVNNLLKSADAIGNQLPAAAEIVQKIKDLAGELMRTVVSSGPPPVEPQAPPV
jgi:hypothetical protein